MNLLCDLSWGRPGGKNIKDGGYIGVIRYLTRDTTGKALSAPERDDYFANGLTIRLVFEDSAQGALKGLDQGFADGQVALSQAKALGLPRGYGIYYAVDFDANESQLQGVIKEYAQGFENGLGGWYKCAPYGGYNTINGLGTSWQTLAWSAGKVSKNANIYQNGKSAFGGAVDIDELRIEDGWNWKSVSASVSKVSPVAVVPQPQLANGPGGSYTVLSGDTLSEIGAKLGADWKAIAALNNISAPYTIYPGETLHISGSPAPAPADVTIRYTVNNGDTLSEIGAKFGVSYELIAERNQINPPYTIYPGQVLIISGANNIPAPVVQTREYTVVSGDTLSGIGSKTGMNWRSIAALNGLSAPFVIYPGQRLRLN